MKKKYRPLLFAAALFTFVSLLFPLKVRAEAAMTAEAASPSHTLPILQYSRLSADQSDATLSPDDFENDLQTLTRLGYATVTVRDLIDYAQRKKELPDKPIMLTFDDGFASDYSYAYPLLVKYNAKAVFAVIGKYADLYSVGGRFGPGTACAYLSWEQMREMHQSGYAEMISHSYDLHSVDDIRIGALRGENEPEGSYQKALAEDYHLQRNKYFTHIGAAPTAFAVPFGAVDEDLERQLKRLGFLAVLTSRARLNRLTGDPEELYRLGRFVRTQHRSLEKLLQG